MMAQFASMPEPMKIQLALDVCGDAIQMLSTIKTKLTLKGTAAGKFDDEQINNMSEIMIMLDIIIKILMIGE